MPKVSKEMTTLVSNIFLTSFIVGFLMLCAGIYLIFSLDLPASFCNGLVVSVLILMIGLPIIKINRHNKEVERRVQGIKVTNIDSMTGIEFEQYLERVLIDQGYSVQTTDVSGDLGVDLIATGKGDKIAIQVKRYSTKVSRRAVSDAVAGMYHYGCDKAMVVTKNYFSPGAIELAESTGCILIDRTILSLWVNEFQSRESQIAQSSNESEQAD